MTYFKTKELTEEQVTAIAAYFTNNALVIRNSARLQAEKGPAKDEARAFFEARKALGIEGYAPLATAVAAIHDRLR